MDIFTLYEAYKQYKKWKEKEEEFEPFNQELGNGKFITFTKEDFSSNLTDEDMEIIISKVKEHLTFIRHPLTLDSGWKEDFINNWFGKNAIRLGYTDIYNQACDDLYEIFQEGKMLLSGKKGMKYGSLFDDSTRIKHKSIYEMILQKFQSRSYWKITSDEH